jgi:hypothetical protein
MLERSDESLKTGMGALGCGERFREAAKFAISFRIVEVGDEPVKSLVISECDRFSSCLTKRGEENCGESFSDDRFSWGNAMVLTESLCAENLAWRVCRSLCWRVWGADLGVVFEGLGERSRIDRALMDLDRECRVFVEDAE